MDQRRGAGGTPGGVGMFLFGLAMASAGGYLLTSNVIVRTGFWDFWGTNSFGITLIPLIIGVALLFYDARNILGWLVLGAGGIFIVAGVLMNMRMWFRPTSLFQTILMLVLLFGGTALILRALRPARRRRERGASEDDLPPGL